MRRALPALFVLAATLAVWSPTLTYGWATTWDDAVFIMGNPHIRAWEWAWMATTQWYGHWMPLTWLSFRANFAFFGDHPGSWHAVNLGFHSISAVLVYFIALRLMPGQQSTERAEPGGDAGVSPGHIGAVVAALVWALHPLRMESVAWISERKDVVLGVFFLAAILLWLRGQRRWAFAAFVAACASKSPAVILPVFLLALEWYRAAASDGGVKPGWWRGLPAKEREHDAEHRGASRDASEMDSRRGNTLPALIPFVAVSALVSVMAFFALHTALMSVPWSVVGLGPRLLHVAYSLVYYATATIWPAHLSGLIEYTWIPSWDQPAYPLAVVIVLAGVVVIGLTRTRWPAVTAAFVCYAVAVLPQSGLFQNGPQLVGNRYSYLASIPLCLLAGGAVAMASRRLPRISFASASAIVAALAAVTLTALPMWRDGDAMWQYAAVHEPTCTQCQDMASAADIRHGDYEGALAKQRQAIAVSATTMYPRWERHWNLAALLIELGREDEARAALKTYLALAAEATLSPPDHFHILSATDVLARLEAKP